MQITDPTSNRPALPEPGGARARVVPQPDRQMVWDAFIRLFHWLLVTMVTIGAVTGLVLGPTWLKLHILAGTVAAALVLARIVWGFAGGRFARFEGFVEGPLKTLHHIAELRDNRAPRHVGHNPAGGWMILLLIAAILLLALTGTIALGGIFKTGPLGFAISYDLGNRINGLHNWLAWGLLGLIAFHIAGAIYESLRTRENLPLAMISGRKRVGENDILPPRRDAHPRTAGLIILGGGAAALLVGTGLALKPVPRLPVTRLDPGYASECGDCHIPYNPSLMSSDRWRLLMDRLDNHFGEDASLDDATRRQLTEWLTAHAAETVDTKPAHVLARADPANPISLTSTPFWKKAHAAIPDAVFRRKPIFARSNCAACHGDAETGMFYPANIKIPEETRK